MYHTLLFLRCKHINFFEDFNFRYIREEGKTALFKPLYYPEKYFYKDTKLTIMKNPVLVNSILIILILLNQITCKRILL